MIKVFRDVLMLGLIILSNAACNPGSPCSRESADRANPLSDVSQAQFYIAEIRDTDRTEHADHWRARKVTSQEGRAALDAWINTHRAAIARAEAAGPLAIYPDLMLHKYTRREFQEVWLTPQLPDPRDSGKPKSKQRWIENIPEADMAHLREIITRHGLNIDWTQEKVPDPGLFISHPARHGNGRPDKVAP